QLGRREGRLDDVVGRLTRGRGRGFDPGDRQRPDLFSTFTGALAVQESLQLDTLVGEDDPPGGRVPAGRMPEEKGAPPGPQPDMEEEPGPAGAPQPQLKSRPKLRELARAIRGKSIPVESLSGPTVKSHPWEQMLAGRKPDSGPLARCVPEDFYLVE